VIFLLAADLMLTPGRDDREDRFVDLGVLGGFA
jgi:hypothetical protein